MIKNSILWTLVLPPLILAVLFLSSCYYDNEEFLYPQTAVCDTTSVTFAASVKPVINSYCVSCHSGPAPSGKVSLESYSQIKAMADQGRLTGVLDGSSGLPQMPPGGALSSCNIAVISIWIKNGALNN